MNVLLGVTGSIAAKLTRKLSQSIKDSGHEIKTVYTNSAYHFTQRTIYGGYGDDEEWEYYHDNDSVLHIDLVKWADVFVIAPCTANTLAKIANGICDNLLTSCVKAWPRDKTRNIILAPAMNSEMWYNKITQDHINTLSYDRFDIIEPIEKKLYCGDTGIGAMAHIDDIVNSIE
jgi:phosphopantothenoylcysteine decarboxylase